MYKQHILVHLEQVQLVEIDYSNKLLISNIHLNLTYNKLNMTNGKLLTLMIPKKPDLIELEITNAKLKMTTTKIGITNTKLKMTKTNTNKKLELTSEDLEITDTKLTKTLSQED